VSLFNDPKFLPERLVVARVDQSTVPAELRIIQRGQNPSHFEIVPREGTSLSLADYVDLLSQIQCFDE